MDSELHCLTSTKRMEHEKSNRQENLVIIMKWCGGSSKCHLRSIGNSKMCLDQYTVKGPAAKSLALRSVTKIEYNAVCCLTNGVFCHPRSLPEVALPAAHSRLCVWMMMQARPLTLQVSLKPQMWLVGCHVAEGSDEISCDCIG